MLRPPNAMKIAHPIKMPMELMILWLHTTKGLLCLQMSTSLLLPVKLGLWLQVTDRKSRNMLKDRSIQTLMPSSLRLQ
jgi:hypothetical protein